jgi:hypothetical protein
MSTPAKVSKVDKYSGIEPHAFGILGTRAVLPWG